VCSQLGAAAVVGGAAVVAVAVPAAINGKHCWTHLLREPRQVLRPEEDNRGPAVEVSESDLLRARGEEAAVCRTMHSW